MPRKCTIQYRQLKTDDLGERYDLKAVLVDVLRRRAAGTQAGQKALAESATLRIIDLDQDQSYVILNKLLDQAVWDGPVFAGQLIHLQAGSEVHAVTQALEEDTEEFVLESLDVGERTRVLRGALYFAIVGNHVGLIEGQQVRGRTLERYLTSLLQKAGELDAGQAIILNSSFRSADGRELPSATAITIDAPQTRRSEAAVRDEVVETETGAERDRGATVFDVLRLMGWSPPSIESLKSDVPDDGWIEGYFKFAIKQRRRTVPIQRATINEALRNIDSGDLGIESGSMGRERGGMYRLTDARSVELVGSLLDPSSAIEQIVNALRDWATSGKIDCDFRG